MADLGTAASALDIAEKVTAGLRWAYRKLRRAPEPSMMVEPRWDFEVRPITFTIELNHQLPFVEARFYAINYLRRPVRLAEVKLTSLQPSGGPVLEHLPLVQEDCPIDATATQFITCRRNLSDAEARALSMRSGPETASFALVAKAKSGKREYKYGPVASRWIEGRVNGKA